MRTVTFVPLRDPDGGTFEGELVRKIEIKGFEEFSFALVIPRCGSYSVSELSTGLALGQRNTEAAALDAAYKLLRERGPDAVRAQIASKLKEFGPLEVQP